MSACTTYTVVESPAYSSGVVNGSVLNDCLQSPEARESAKPVTVTVCAVFQFAAVKVSGPVTRRGHGSSQWSTTSAVGSLDSFTVNVAVPPSSVTRSRSDDDVTGDTTNPAVSSSVSVSVTPAGAGADTLLPLETALITIIACLSGESTSFPFAVTVTVPVLVVEPAAIVSVSLDRLKSAATTPGPDAPTVTVTATLDAPESVAVTVETPPSSGIDVCDSASVTAGLASSSSSASLTSDGAATPLPPEAAPETVTCLSGESTAFPFAVTVTAPALVVEPAAMVSVVALDSTKSAATAPAPAAAPTVTVTASLDAPDSVAVTVETPPLSEIDAGDRTSATVGSVSSSVSVSAAPVTATVSDSAVAWSFVTVAVTVVERPPPPWCVASSTAVTVAVSAAFDMLPAEMTMLASEPTV